VAPITDGVLVDEIDNRCCHVIVGLGLRISCLTPHSTIFQIYRCGQFIVEENRTTRKKTTDMSQVTEKFYQIKLHRVHLAMGSVRNQSFSGDRH
jgi:hypothetical protein